MIRRIGIVLFVAGLVVLAGCSGVSSGPSSDTDTLTTDAGSDPGGDETTTTGVGGGDVTLVENRTAALQAAGGYTAVWEMKYTEDGTVTGRTTYTTRVDYENERSSFDMRIVSDGEVSSEYETFHADGTNYVRYGSGEDATYQMSEAPFQPGNTMVPVTSYITDATDLAEFEAVGTETFDGVTVTRYERTDQPSWIAAQNPESDFTWTEFTYTVLVDKDGVVRSETWGGTGVDGDGVTQTITFTFSLTDVGTTVVEEPDWVSTAREEAAQ